MYRVTGPNGEVIDLAPTEYEALRYYQREPGYTVHEDEAAPRPPARSASKADWVAWAQTRAADEDELASIDALTKDELIASYGE